MGPFHVVHLVGHALDECRRRVQQDTYGRRGRAGDALYTAPRMLHTGVDLLTDTQDQRLRALFDGDVHVEVEATWGVYQQMIAAYRAPDRSRGRHMMRQVIDSLASGVPAALTELRTLGRTLARRAGDIMAYSTGPAPVMGPPKPSLSGILGRLCGLPSASATSRTTSPAASDPNYPSNVKSWITLADSSVAAVCGLSPG